MAKLEQHLDSEDIQLLEAIRGFVDSRISAYVAANDTDDEDTEDVPFDEDGTDTVEDEEPAAGNNVWTRQELDAMSLKDLRQLAKDIGFRPAGGGIPKKTEIFDYLERNKRIVDEVPDNTDVEDEESEEDADDGVTFEDLLDKEKFPFKDLLKYADENEIEIEDDWRTAKASNRRKIARVLIQALAEADEDEEE